MDEPITMNCPSCSSPLEIRGTETEMQCSYCGNTVVVPHELREQVQALNTQRIVSEIDAMRGGLFRQFYIGAAIWVGGFAVLIVFIVLAALLFQIFSGHR